MPHNDDENEMCFGEDDFVLTDEIKEFMEDLTRSFVLKEEQRKRLSKSPNMDAYSQAALHRAFKADTHGLETWTKIYLMCGENKCSFVSFGTSPKIVEKRPIAWPVGCRYPDFLCYQDFYEASMFITKRAVGHKPGKYGAALGVLLA